MLNSKNKDYIYVDAPAGFEKTTMLKHIIVENNIN